MASHVAHVQFLLGLLAILGQDHEQALLHLREAVRHDPNNYRAWVFAAYCLGELGRWDLAIEAYRTSLAIEPKDAETHNDLGVAYAKTGRWDNAIAAFRQAIRVQPSYAPAHYDLGVACAKPRQFEAAIRSYEEAIRIKPDFLKAFNDVAVAYASLGRYREALEACQNATRIDQTIRRRTITLAWLT